MPPSCRRASANLHVPVSQPLSYIRRGPRPSAEPWREHPTLLSTSSLDSARPGTCPAQGPNGVSW